MEEGKRGWRKGRKEGLEERKEGRKDIGSYS
jgi:hypothetical protein